MKMLEVEAKERDRCKRNDCVNARKREMKDRTLKSGRWMSSTRKEGHTYGALGVRTGTSTGSKGGRCAGK